MLILTVFTAVESPWNNRCANDSTRGHQEVFVLSAAGRWGDGRPREVSVLLRENKIDNHIHTYSTGFP